MAEYSRTVGDTAPNFYAQLTDADGDPANLLNAEARFIMRPVRGTGPKVASPAVIDDELLAKVHYAPAAADVDEEGGFLIDWEITYSNGLIETFPNHRSMTCDILPDLEAAEGS